MEVTRAFDGGLCDLPIGGHGLRTQGAPPSEWRIPVVLVSFSDDALSYGPQDFNLALFDTTLSTPTGSVFDYYRWVSGGRLSVQGEVVAVVSLPHDRNYYAQNQYGLNVVGTPNNIYGAIKDALVACDSQVDWSGFDLGLDGFVDMLWFVHAGRGGEAGGAPNALWSLTSRLSAGWRNGEAFITSDPVPGSGTEFIRVDRFSCLPELSGFIPGARSEIGVYCHEFGHALGLPDLYDTSTLGGGANVGPGNWSLMSTGAYGTDGHSPSYPSHLGAWPALFLGWVESSRPSENTVLTVAPIERDSSVVEFWFQGESNPEHFLIENRQREGFDRNLPEEGLIVYHVDDAAIAAGLASNRVNVGPNPGLRVVEADGDFDMVLGVNRGDANDPFPGALGRTSMDDAGQPNTRSFSGAPTNLGLRSIRRDGSDMVCFAQVRALGWLPPADHTGPGLARVGAPGPAVTAAADADGNLYSVSAEMVGGHPQVVLRTRLGSSWQPVLVISASPAGAIEPSLAVLPNGDLTVVWSDLREGRSRIFHRSRNAGVWTSEQTLVDLFGDSRSPALAGDGQGTLHLAFLNRLNGNPSIWFKSFSQLSVAGNLVRVTSPNYIPAAPALASNGDGHCYVLWPDSSALPEKLWFARVHPDSGLSENLPLTPNTAYAQFSVRAIVDGSGALHSVWLAAGPGANELHWQRRDFGGTASLADTVLESSVGAMLNPCLAVDPSDGLHLAFELAGASANQIRYRRRAPGDEWDFRSTEITRETEDGGILPALVPTSPGNVTVLYTGTSPSGPRFMERQRVLDSQVLSVAPGPGPITAALALGPNPLRAGQALELRWNGPVPVRNATVDVFDVSGRRTAVVRLGGGDVRRGRIDAGITAGWPGGLYFARVRDDPAAVARLILLR